MEAHYISSTRKTTKSNKLQSKDGVKRTTVERMTGENNENNENKWQERMKQKHSSRRCKLASASAQDTAAVVQGGSGPCGIWLPAVRAECTVRYKRLGTTMDNWSSATCMN